MLACLPGKSIVYLGGGPRRDSIATDAVPQLAPATEPQQRPDSCDVVVTSPPPLDDVTKAADGGSEEDNNSTTDVISTSSAIVSVSRNQGNQDSACIMSADESSDCSLLTATHHQEQEPDTDKT